MIEMTSGGNQDTVATVVERRSRPRLRYKTTVHLTSESNFYTGFSTNLSEGGIFVATHLLHAPGTAIEVEFSLPDGGPPILVETEVRWVCDAYASDRPGMGLKFRDLAEGDRQRIERFVETRETLFFEE